MPEPTADQLFADHLARMIGMYQQERQRHKHAAWVLKIATVAMAGLVTILLGWRFEGGGETPPFLANASLVLGAMITVVSAYEAFFDPRTLWIRETVVLVKLKDLERDLAYLRAEAGDGPIDRAKLGEMREAFNLILQSSLKSWLRLRGVEDT